MTPSDYNYCGIPWKKGGTDRLGLDCKGLVQLFLQEEFGFTAPAPESPVAPAEMGGLAEKFLENLREERDRGDMVFFRKRDTGCISHVCVYLGDNKFLNIVYGTSRIENGTKLMQRLGYEKVGAIGVDDTDKICRALADGRLGDPTFWILVAVSIVLSAASYFLAPKPKLGKFANQKGRYSGDSLVTQTSSEIPLPDLLGSVTVAGNSPFTSPADKTQTVSNATVQAANKVVVLGAGPVEEIDYAAFNLKINGLQWDNKYWRGDVTYPGFAINPAQTKAEAVTGTIGGVTNVPSISVYTGAHATSVPVDVRAQYDRTFPIYGFNGCAYLVFRLINSTKFPSMNITATIRGRKCRTFNANGWVVTTVTESFATGYGLFKFKLLHDDIVRITSFTRSGGTIYHEMDATHQTGNVYYLNRTKGYFELIASFMAGSTYDVTYEYYTRAWTDNPASHIVYLLTEPLRGKGFPESKIDWPSAVSLRAHCDELVRWWNSSGAYYEKRHTCNYALDYRKPIQEHLRAVLDSCYGYLFLSNGKFVVKARAASASVFTFNQTNILKDSFSSEGIERSERANRIHVFIHASETYNAETGVVRDDLADQRARADLMGNDGIEDETLKFPAIDSISQAERVAETILREEVNTRWVCEFKTTIKGLALEPGDVIDITHSAQPTWSAKLFRIEDLSYDQEDRLSLKCSEYFGGAYI